MIARRLANRLFGSGPWRVAPFEVVASERNDEATRGVHKAESFAGIVRREDEMGYLYPPRTALFGQPDHGEMLPTGSRYRRNGIAAGEPKLLYTLTDAGIAGRDGVVYCPRSRVAVRETVRQWKASAHAHPLLSATGFPPPRPLPGVSISLATLDAEGFYHFLIESLPRLWLARDIIASVQQVLVSGERQPGCEAWLARAGLPSEKIRWLDGHAHYRCDQLLFSGPPLRDCQPTPWVRDALRGLLHVSPAAPGGRWLWITRAGARQRDLTWEDRLLARLPRFEKIALGARSPSEQIELFTQAAVVAGPHGGGLANLIFAPANARLIELFPDEHTIPLYARMAQVSGGRAAWATVDFTQPADLERLVAACEAFLA